MHFAAIPRVLIEPDNKTFQANVTSTYNVIEAAMKLGVRKVVTRVQCISCHMPELNHAGLKIEGTGARGHTFGVGAETCTGCHREMVHQSHENATLEEEVAQLKSVEPVALEQKLGTLEEQSAKQREALQANRRVFMPIVGLAFLLGGFFGYALPRYRSRKQTAVLEERPKKP